MFPNRIYVFIFLVFIMSNILNGQDFKQLLRGTWNGSEKMSSIPQNTFSRLYENKIIIYGDTMIYYVYEGYGENGIYEKGKYSINLDTLVFQLNEEIGLSYNTGTTMYHYKYKTKQRKFLLTYLRPLSKSCEDLKFKNLRLIALNKVSEIDDSPKSNGHYRRHKIFIPTSKSQDFIWDFKKWKKRGIIDKDY